jgi:hypothetical protein
MSEVCCLGARDHLVDHLGFYSSCVFWLANNLSSFSMPTLRPHVQKNALLSVKGFSYEHGMVRHIVLCLEGNSSCTCGHYLEHRSFVALRLFM